MNIMLLDVIFGSVRAACNPYSIVWILLDRLPTAGCGCCGRWKAIVLSLCVDMVRAAQAKWRLSLTTGSAQSELHSTHASAVRHFVAAVCFIAATAAL